MKYSGHVVGDILLQNGYDISELVSVSGYVYVYSNGTFTAPMLTNAGDVYVPGSSTFNAPALTAAVSVRVYGTLNAPLLGKIIAKYQDQYLISQYSLFAHVDGRFSAGCRMNLTRDEALKHWNRTDSRAVLFTQAILAYE